MRSVPAVSWRTIASSRTLALGAALCAACSSSTKDLPVAPRSDVSFATDTAVTTTTSRASLAEAVAGRTGRMRFRRERRASAVAAQPTVLSGSEADAMFQSVAARESAAGRGSLAALFARRAAAITAMDTMRAPSRGAAFSRSGTGPTTAANHDDASGGARIIDAYSSIGCNSFDLGYVTGTVVFYGSRGRNTLNYSCRDYYGTTLQANTYATEGYTSVPCSGGFIACAERGLWTTTLRLWGIRQPCDVSGDVNALHAAFWNAANMITWGTDAIGSSYHDWGSPCATVTITGGGGGYYDGYIGGSCPNPVFQYVILEMRTRDSADWQTVWSGWARVCE